MRKNSFKFQVYDLVKKIPQGQVMTYGQIARKLSRPKAARAVGNILHYNSSLQVPCHRVVNKKGRVSFNFAHGGAEKQYQILLKEGVKFKDKLHAILK
jgi:methylated-DNA-protein-cysteine methyltransferase-like protein